jgi:hypothetical protein
VSDVETLGDLAVRLKMSVSWTQKHWREVPDLPRPFIGAGKHEHPRWRRADLDRYFAGEQTAMVPIDAAAEDQPIVPAALSRSPRPIPAPAANAEDPGITALLRSAGG